MPITRAPQFKTEAETQLAKDLGFRPPVPQPAVEAPVKGATTNVMGYFNNNPWPVHIAISSLGIALHLDQRGDYVMSNGRKVNDPILDAYVGPGQLAREISKVPVPVVRIIPNKSEVLDATHSVHGTMLMEKDKEGIVIRPIMTRYTDPTSSIPLPNSAPVVGMTMEKARKLHLVKPIIERQESQVADTFGNPAPAREIPTIDDVMPHDATPGEQRRLNAEAKTAHPGLASPESPSQAQIQSEIAAANTNEAVVTDAVAAALRAANGVPVDPTANLPKPQLGESTSPFVCNVDGEEFETRAALLAYAKSKFPDSAAEIMSAYPKTK